MVTQPVHTYSMGAVVSSIFLQSTIPTFTKLDYRWSHVIWNLTSPNHKQAKGITKERAWLGTVYTFVDLII